MIDNKDKLRENSLKAGFWYVFSEIFVRGISFFSTPIYTRILPTEVFGNVRVFDSWIYILVPLFSLSLYNSVERAKLDFKEKYDAYISSIISLVLILFGILGIISLIWKEPLKRILSFSDTMLWIAIIYGFAYVCILCMQRRERQLFHYKSNILISFFSVVPPILLSVVMVLKYQNVTCDRLTDIRIMSFYTPTIILGLIILGIIYYRGRTIVNLEYWNYGIRFSLPLVIYAVSAQILYQSDKIMIQRISGKTLAGIYSLATTIVYIVDILSNAVQGAWVPWLFEELNEKRTKEVKRVWVLMTIGMGFLSWMIVMLAPELVWFLGGDRYQPAKWLLGSMLSAAVFQFVMLSFVSIEKFYKKTRCSGQASILVAILNIGLNYVCIQKFGYQAAAYTTAFSYFVAILIHYFFVRKKIKEKIVPMIELILICGGVWIFNMFSMLSYQLPFFVRWIILGIVVMGLAVWKKDKIVKMINLIRNKEVKVSYENS